MDLLSISDLIEQLRQILGLDDLSGLAQTVAYAKGAGSISTSDVIVLLGLIVFSEAVTSSQHATRCRAR